MRLVDLIGSRVLFTKRNGIPGRYMYKIKGGSRSINKLVKDIHSSSGRLEMDSHWRKRGYMSIKEIVKEIHSNGIIMTVKVIKI